jgi:Domain of unknown function (DUF4440)
MTQTLKRNPKIDEEFKDLERGWVAAYLQGNRELFERIWTHGFIFTFPFAQFSDKEQALADIKSGNLAFESFCTEALTIKVHGDTAVMAGHFTLKGRYQGHDISGEYRYTNVLEKHLNQPWQIGASHATLVN